MTFSEAASSAVVPCKTRQGGLRSGGPPGAILKEPIRFERSSQVSCKETLRDERRASSGGRVGRQGGGLMRSCFALISELFQVS